MNRGGLLPKKRARPRRNEGRVAHGRIKRKAGHYTPEEKAHVARVRTLPCCVSAKVGAVAHHLMRAPDKRCRRDHRWVVPLSPELHNGGDVSVHALATEAAFEQHHGLAPGYLIATARRLWEESNAGS